MVFDEHGDFLSKQQYHTDFLQAEAFATLDAISQDSLKALIELHAEKSASSRAQWILADWEQIAKKFVRLTPIRS